MRSIVIILSCWLALTSLVQSFKCPYMTQTQVTIRVFKSAILDFKDCN